MTGFETRSMGIGKKRDFPCLFSRQKAWGFEILVIPHDHSGMGIYKLLKSP